MQTTSIRDFLRSLPAKERELLAHRAGYSGAYLTAMIYRENEPTSFSLAVEVDKATGGAIDFRSVINRTDCIDWEYIKKKLTA